MYIFLRIEDRRIPKRIFTYNPKKRRNIGRPLLGFGGPTYFSRGWNRLSMALSTMMMPIMMMILLTAGVDLVPPA
jgi:hypothetical protein